MDLLGTITNVAAIVTGTLVGMLLKKGISEAAKSTVMQGLGLAILLVGAQMALQTNNILIVIISLIIGGVIGELLNIEGGLARLGRSLERRAGGSGGNVTRAFVTTSLIYCVGAMAILGSIEDGLTGQPNTLYAKSLLDGATAVFFASTMGIGVIFSAIPVFIYQGAITLLSSQIKDFLSPAVIAEMTATGGLLIVGISLTVLGIKEIRVGNLLPSVLVAVILAILVQRYNFAALLN